MAENLYNSQHKSTSKEYRTNYDLIFSKDKKMKEGPTKLICKPSQYKEAIKIIESLNKKCTHK